MCGFISWITHNGKVLFLTDKEVFSAKGKRLLAEYHGNDIFSYSAIRKYFSLTLSQGNECGQDDFWNAETLPEPLKTFFATPESLLATWGKMFESGVFENQDLHYIICRAPKAYKEKAWLQFLAQNPSIYDLLLIVVYAPEPYKKKAWLKALTKNPSIYNLRWVIYTAPEPYKEKAWRQLLKLHPSDDELRRVVAYAPELYKKRARAILKKRTS